MAVINDSTNVGAVDDKRKNTPPGNCVAPFNHNNMLQNKNVQVENEEDNEENIHPFGYADLAAFKNKMLILGYAVYRVLTMRPTKEPLMQEY
eukprot:8722402-Ditylum_brightwellii.AAC.1